MTAEHGHRQDQVNKDRHRRLLPWWTAFGIKSDPAYAVPEVVGASVLETYAAAEKIAYQGVPDEKRPNFNNPEHHLHDDA